MKRGLPSESARPSGSAAGRAAVASGRRAAHPLPRAARPSPHAAHPLPDASTAPRRQVVHRERGRFGDVLVVDERWRRTLRFGSIAGADQSVLDRRAPERLVSAYLHAVLIGALLAEPLERVLLVGLGGGGFVRFARRSFPDAHIEAVEVDPVVVRLARRYFGVRPDARFTIRVGDGAARLAEIAAADERYDLIVLDAYGSTHIPAELESRAFFESVRTALTPHGIAVANVGLAEVRAEDATLARLANVFRGRCFELRNARDDNRVAIAGRAPLPGPRELVEHVRRIDASGRFPLVELEPIARTRRPCPLRRTARAS